MVARTNELSLCAFCHGRESACTRTKERDNDDIKNGNKRRKRETRDHIRWQSLMQIDSLPPKINY